MNYKLDPLRNNLSLALKNKITPTTRTNANNTNNTNGEREIDCEATGYGKIEKLWITKLPDFIPWTKLKGNVSAYLICGPSVRAKQIKNFVIQGP